MIISVLHVPFRYHFINSRFSVPLLLGTYNNQYMVIDLKKVELKKNIHDDALWVAEQIPTKVAAGDMTPMLRTGNL